MGLSVPVHLFYNLRSLGRESGACLLPCRTSFVEI